MLVSTMADERTYRILVIDDEEIVHASFRKLLSRHGYAIVGALTAMEGMELLRKESFDLVVTDLIMPGKNGSSCCGICTTRGSRCQCW